MNFDARERMKWQLAALEAVPNPTTDQLKTIDKMRRMIGRPPEPPSPSQQYQTPWQRKMHRWLHRKGGTREIV